jgi:hypothetical protein
LNLLNFVQGNLVPPKTPGSANGKPLRHHMEMGRKAAEINKNGQPEAAPAFGACI